MIPLVRRNKVVSIGKRTYGDSIGASMKAKMALDANQRFTKEGLKNSILGEIKDELKIERKDIIFSIEENVIAAYRDLVEGGKPQLLFVAKSLRTQKEIEDNFVKKKKEKAKELRKSFWDKELRELEDGDTFLWIPVENLKKLVILSDAIVYEGKEYRMMPSASASLVMLIWWLELVKKAMGGKCKQANENDCCISSSTCKLCSGGGLSGIYES